MRPLDDLWRELPRAARTLRRAPTASLLALLTLALGIGACAAIFSVVEAALLRPLPFRDPARLAEVTLRMPVQYGPRVIDMVWSYPKARAFRDAQTAFEALSLHEPEPVTVATEGGDGAERLPAELVEAPYLALLGIGAERGRTFEAADEGTPTVVIGHALAVRRFGGADAAVGRPLDVEGRAFTVVGVLPARFHGLSGGAELWLLLRSVRTPAALRSVGAHQYRLVARRAVGVSPERARADVARAGAAIDGVFPEDDGHWSAAAYALDDLRVDPALRRSVVVLSAAVALVLLIACVNVANLTLARGAARTRELAVRHALGADRRRLVRQLVTEGLVLTGAGAVVGLALAVLLARLLRAVAPVAAGALPAGGGSEPLTRVTLAAIGLDARAVLFTTGVALLTGVLVSLAPALVTTRAALVQSLRQGATAVPAFAGLRRLTGRGALVAAEVALAVVLLVGAGLTLRSLGRLLDAQVGYDPRDVLTARVSLSPVRYASDSAVRFWEDVLGRVRALPGVESAALASCAPVGDDCEGTGITLAGRADVAHVGLVYVSPDYFRAMRTPLLRGRAFTDADRRGAVPVMLVNETAARTIWGDADPLHTPTTGDPATGDGARQVVGVVADYRIEDPEAPVRPAIFVPFLQNPRARGMLVVRAAVPPATLAGAVRRTVAALDRLHAVHDVKPMRDRIADATARGRFSARVLGAFAGAALLLAAIGLYGVLALAVTQRRREFGVRLALGADHRAVVAMVLREAMALVALGAAVGVVGALAAGRALRSLLYDLAPADPWTYAGTVAVLALAAATAALVPAVRAARASPLEAMRGVE